MYLLYTDESNVNPTEGDFFVYAGVAIPSDRAPVLSEAVERIRTENGYRPADPLKFNTRDRAEHITPEMHRSAKAAVINAAAEAGVKLFASMIHHGVARSPDQARRFEINRICYHFDAFLRGARDKGLVLVDTFEGGLPDILKEKFQIGLKWRTEGGTTRMENILGYHVAFIGASHFSSVVDILLGGFRFIVNQYNAANRPDATVVLAEVLRPFWLRAGDGRISELSLFSSPREIWVDEYLEMHWALLAYLKELGIDAEQAPRRRRLG